MASPKKQRRRKSDFGGKYQPVTGLSTHPQDLDYIRRNIPCQWACPALTDVPGYIKAIHEGDFAVAYTINRKANLMPGILGRICSRPCESYCRHGESDLGDPVSICHLKRLAADSSSDDYHVSEKMFTTTGKSVAVVGGGPAGLSAAHALALFGHRVTIYESKPKLGGMLLYGIPNFRLPPDLIEREIFNIIRLGVMVVHNVRLGEDIPLKKLRDTYDAVVLALGCYQENKLHIEGEEHKNVYSGLEFMVRLNENSPLPVGKKVAVIGGGFTAMDCSRSALRLGATQVINYIRRTEEELAVTKDEIFEAKKEGVRLVSLVTPVAITKEDGNLKIKLARTRLVAAPGGIGKKPVQIEGSEFLCDADTIIVAIGQRPDMAPVWPAENRPSLDKTGADTKGLFLAGDCHNGASTVIEAIAHAQKVADKCDEYMMGRKRSQWQVSCETGNDTTRERAWDFIEQNHVPTLETGTRLAKPEAEVEMGFEATQGNIESSRCYLCNLRYKIHVPDCIYCRWCIDLCPRNCIHLTASLIKEDGMLVERLVKTDQWDETAAIVIDSDRCIRCGECLRICPTQCIHVTKVGLHYRFIQS